MAALKMLGDWLDSGGWVNTLVQAHIMMPGTADSFLQVATLEELKKSLQQHSTSCNTGLMTATVGEKLMMQKINFSLKIGATRDNIFISFSGGQPYWNKKYGYWSICVY